MGDQCGDEEESGAGEEASRESGREWQGGAEEGVVRMIAALVTDLFPAFKQVWWNLDTRLTKRIELGS